ncbi:MAG: LacI family transcriptional regulator [Rhodobacteraceae bacterium]|nr:LacI family transcriptional regulator [Paracoccaceae bacterium]
MGRPTVHDIAREAGVSLATVDRVLNARPGVRAQTVERVQNAVQRLGYVRDTYAANLARQREYRFAFVLPDGASQFVETFKAALQEAIGAQIGERISARIEAVPSHDPHAVVRVLNALPADKLDGVAIMTPETPQVRDAVARLKDEGLPVVALVSDLPSSGRDHFVGINSFQAGRTAGVLMGRFACAKSGQVLVVTNSMHARDSVERRLGFDEVMAETFPHISVLPSLETHDDPDRTDRIIAEAFRSNSDLLGVYSMGPGNVALLNALRSTGRLQDLVVVAHELTPSTRIALQDGEIDAVINQNVGHLVRSALRVLRAKCDGSEIFEAQERIRIDIVLRENLP